MSTHCFVDANHAGNTETRRSQTGILLFCNKAPVMWFSKRQNSVEASTFGSEFTAMKNAVEMMEALRYKLRMFGVPIDGPTNVFYANPPVCKSTTRPKATLTKKRHSIAYHRSREAFAAGTVRVSKEDTLTNLADIFTKAMSAPKREYKSAANKLSKLDLSTYAPQPTTGSTTADLHHARKYQILNSSKVLPPKEKLRENVDVDD